MNFEILSRAIERDSGSFFGLMGLSFLIPFIMVIVIFGVVIGAIVKANKKNNETMNRIQTNYSDTVNKYYNILINDPVLSKIRQDTKVTSKIGLVLVIVGFATFFFLSIISMAMIIGGFILMNLKKGEYAKHYKGSIMKTALQEYDSNLTYFPEGCIPEPIYDAANFEMYDRYHSEDRINGKVSGYDFMMADVHVEDRRRDSEGRTHYVTLFNGPVAILTLPEYINLNLSIVNNRIKLFTGGTHVEIDNPEFEEIYDVFSDNQITAMRVLTPAVTNKMLDLYRKYDFYFEVKIINNQLYFRFHTGNLFVPNPGDTYAEATSVALYFEILDGIKEIIDEIIKATKFLRKK